MVGAASFDISSCHQQPTIVASFFDNVNRLQMLHQQPSLTLTSWSSFFDNGNHLLLEDGLQMLPYKMTIFQQSPPLPFMWAIVFLFLQHMLASYSSSKLTILRASLAKFTGTRQTFQSPESPKHIFSHTKGSLQPDGLSHHI